MLDVLERYFTYALDTHSNLLPIVEAEDPP